MGAIETGGGAKPKKGNTMSRLSGRVLTVILAAGLSAVAASPAGAATETVLHAFRGGSDGSLPVAALVKWHGTLYGTTQNGGSTDNGTVFSVTAARVETVLYSFKGGSDGAYPDAGLINVGGTFYGTTYGGGGTGCTGHGAIGCGTVFSVTPAGVETVLYAFKGGKDGSALFGGVVEVNGVFYGATDLGGGSGCGGSGCGTVFSVTPAGVETVLHTFKGGGDGANPIAGLLADGGTLYGSTSQGGGRTCIGVSGCGTVFSVTPAGVKTVLYTFKGGADGYYPTGDLIDDGGTLYGTTVFGGVYNSCGAVFSVTPAGVETVMHAFRPGGNHGCYPIGGLVELNGKFYGATRFGGASGLGAVFSVGPLGFEKVVYSFKGGGDGAYPSIGLMKMNGTLYGTTQYGGGETGCGGFGCGTVFSVTP